MLAKYHCPKVSANLFTISLEGSSLFLAANNLGIASKVASLHRAVLSETSFLIAGFISGSLGFFYFKMKNDR